MTILVNFSGKNFEQSRFRLNASAEKNGIDKIFSYDETFVRATDFYKKHQNIFSHTKGFGYWLWKPFLILEVLNSCNEGDIVVYSDAGIEIIDSIAPLLSLCHKKEIILFANGNLKNKYWVKRDCFVLMQADKKPFWNGLQVDAAFCLFKNNVRTKSFVQEWLSFCVDERIIGDNRNVMGKSNFWGFRAHRHDQSILSVLTARHSIELFRQPTQFGNYYKTIPYRVKEEFKCVNQFNSKSLTHYSAHPYNNSPYFQLLDHHRTKTENTNQEDLSLRRRITKAVTKRINKITKFVTRQ